MSRIWEKKECKYARTLVNNQVTAIFLTQNTQRNFNPNLYSVVRRRHVGAYPDGHQHGGRKPTQF